MAAGAVLGSACTWQDVQHNVVSGSLSFVEGYTTSVWEAIVLPADEIFRADDDEG
jgi:hypothetical protein